MQVQTVTASEAGLYSNTHLIEAENGVVVVDPPMLVHDAQAVATRLAELDGPLAGLIYTHPHPDHVNGGTLLRDGRDVPVYAARDTERVLREVDGPKREFWTKVYGDDYPRETTFPTVLVDPGDTVDIAGLLLTVHDLGAGECATGAAWRLDLPGQRVAFTGDLAYAQVHPWLYEGRSQRWLVQLDQARRVLEDVEVLHIGHGPSGGLELLDAQADYIRAYQQHVRDLADGRPSLSEDAKAELERRMAAHLPGGLLPSLVTMSADAIAAELHTV